MKTKSNVLQMKEKFFIELKLYNWTLVQLVFSNINEKKYKHNFTNSHSAANNQNYCQQCKNIINPADKIFVLEPYEQQNIENRFHCEKKTQKI